MNQTQKNQAQKNPTQTQTHTPTQTPNQTQTQTQIHKNQTQNQKNQTQNQKNQNAAAIQDIHDKINQPNKMTHEIRDPHGILDVIASRSRL